MYAPNPHLVNILVEHVITADSATGEPWPPSDGKFYSVVRSMRGFTLWRRIKLSDGIEK